MLRQFQNPSFYFEFEIDNKKTTIDDVGQNRRLKFSNLLQQRLYRKAFVIGHQSWKRAREKLGERERVKKFPLQ